MSNISLLEVTTDAEILTIENSFIFYPFFLFPHLLSSGRMELCEILKRGKKSIFIFLFFFSEIRDTH